MDKHTPPTTAVGVLDKAIAIIDALAESPCALADLVAATGQSRPTAHRIATALEQHSWVARDGDGRFVLGPRLAELAAAPGGGLIAMAGPVLEGLRASSGESAQLYVRQGDERVCVAVADRASGLRDSVPLGARLTMGAGSAAQVLLAWEPATEQRRLLAHAAYAPRTLAEVRRRGWAHSAGEREAGVASVSAPVHDRAGTVIAAVSVSGPIERMGRSPGPRLGPLVVAAARALSAAPATAMAPGQ